MAINYKYKTIFIHLPKTAGTSMESKEFIGPERNQTHWSLNMFTQQLKNPQEYFKWCFSRNPYSRLVSAYEWGVKNHKEQYLKDINSFQNFIDKIEEFWDFNGTSIQQTRSGIHTIPQHIFINGDKNNIDFIGRFENLGRDFELLCEKISSHSGLKISNTQLPITKKTKSIDYKTYYNKNIIKKINKLYEKDFILFDYEMI